MTDELRRVWLDASRETDKLRDEAAVVGNRLQCAIEKETTAWKAYCSAMETKVLPEPDAQFFLDNAGAIDFGTPPVVICEGCKNEIDPETCGCGDPIKGHSWSSGHAAIPMGCDCHRATVNR